MKEIKYREIYKNGDENIISYNVVGKPVKILNGLKLIQRDLFTGLQDKHNQDIYENDLINYEDKGSLTCDFEEEQVEWDKKHGHFATESTDCVWAEVARLSEIVGYKLK